MRASLFLLALWNATSCSMNTQVLARNRIEFVKNFHTYSLDEFQDRWIETYAKQFNYTRFLSLAEIRKKKYIEERNYYARQGTQSGVQALACISLGFTKNLLLSDRQLPEAFLKIHDSLKTVELAVGGFFTFRCAENFKKVHAFEHDIKNLNAIILWLQKRYDV